MPSYIILSILEGIMCGLVYSAEAVTVYTILNALGTGESFAKLTYLIIYIALFYLITSVLDKLYWIIIHPLIAQTLHYRMHRELFLKAQSLDLSCYDNPIFYNDFIFAMDEADSRAIKIVNGIGTLINRLVASGTLLGLLFTIDTIIAFLILVVSALTTFAWLYCNRLNFKQNDECKPLRRKTNYINRTFHLVDYAKEIRTSQVADLLLADYNATQHKLINIQKKYGKKFFIMHGFINNILYIGLLLVTILRMFIKLLAGEVLLGEFAAGVNTILRVRRFFFDICQHISRFPEHSLYIEKYRNFMNTIPTITNGSISIPDEFESLELRHVCFSYADKVCQTKEILHDINITIKRGDKIALVGYNGAGKTTIIKLILRLYDPTSGQILWNGIDIRKFNLNDYRNKIGAVFQDYKLFATSIAENVLCSKYTEDKKSDVLNALDISNFTSKLATFKDGIHTQLTKEFLQEGTNLSGGEAQKIAIARVFASSHSLIIMDEPSSALDPLSEYALNQNILAHCHNSTVIFISHRLSTTQMANKIFMLSNGHIIEAGDHLQLLEKGGAYATMFNIQAKKYVNNNENHSD